MRAHCLQHVPFEGLASIEPWLLTQGYELTFTRFFESAELPDPQAIHLLVIMGGPMSVNDEAELPWLIAEKRFIRELIDAGIPVLGICLGAQLIANALGARVYPNALREIGWWPVQAVAGGADAAFKFPASLVVFHWHGETFDLPPGARLLASSEACVNQAFQLGQRVIGLQFHLEMTPESLQKLIAHCGDDQVAGPYVQTGAELRSADFIRYTDINVVLQQVLAYLTRGDA